MALTNDYPTIRPSLLLDFARAQALDPRITFTRASIATRVNEEGYVETVESGVPRFDFDPVTLTSKGLLIEEQRTNLLTYSEDFGNAVWSKNNATVTTDTVVSPSNATTGDTLAQTASLGYLSQLYATSATTYTLSVFAKASAAGDYLGMVIQPSYANRAGARFDLNAGTVVGASAPGGSTTTVVGTTITSFGNGWYRCTFTATVAEVNASARWYYGPSDSTQSNTDPFGSSTLRTIYLWGAQLEAGANPTSYIPTTTATVQRNADTCSIQSIGSFFNPSEGALYFKVAPTPQTGASIVQYPAIGFTPAGLDSGKTIQVFKASNTNTWYYLVRTSTGDVVNITYANAALSTAAIAIAYKVNDFAASLNGATALTDTSGDLPLSTELTALDIGSFNSTGRINSAISKIAYYPVRLTNAQLQALTRS